MSAVTVSPKYQVVIPLEIRKKMGIVPGQKMQVIALDGHIELVAEQPMSAYRGMFPGINTDVEREDDRL
jgi:AbrB family looped-hinge helix DNA binding protein